MQIRIGISRGVDGLSRVVLAVFAVVVLCACVSGSARAAFDVSGFDGQWTVDSAGGVYTQAGGHPYAFSTEIEVTHHVDPLFSDLTPDAPVKDVFTSLPAGLVGNPGVAGVCTSAQLVPSFERGFFPACPISSQVGVATVLEGGIPISAPLFNMQSPPNVPARLGFNILGVPVALDASLRSDGDYGLDINSRDISEALPTYAVTVTVWGVPADPSHDQDRCLGFHFFPSPGPLCTETEDVRAPHAAGVAPVPFLTLPTRCTAPGVGLETRVRVDSWHEPGVFKEASFLTHEAPYFPAAPGEWGGQVGLSGCDRVPFTPGIDVAPTVSAPDSPTGLDVSLRFPTDGLENPRGVAQADLKKTVVSLPQGLVVNPAVADGLGVCTPAQVGLGSKEDATCPNASKIGTVEADTPLLTSPLEGALYLASQGDNPFGSLLAAYLVAKGSGVIVKLPVKLEADPVSGRLTTTIDNSPQSPLSDVKITVKGGSRAPLTTPSVCGSTQTESTLEGWTGASVALNTPYTVDCAPGLGAFNPSFTAGVSNNQAGAFSPFVLSFSRQDGEQGLSGLTVRTPPGLLGIIKSVTQCPEPQAAQGTCGEASLVGHVSAAAGAGPSPFWVQGGRAYLTGPYKGSPFGLSVVVPAQAGPIDLGTVVVRSRIDVDPHTSQITVTSDPFPTILQGIPLQIRTVNVTVDRAGFTFNPTNCNALSVDGTISSTQGASAAVSSHFQAANCASLPFKPTFKVSTQAATSKKNGASLDVQVTSGQGQANIGRVAVTLPKQLPSRLTTIQQACPEGVFAANPAGCPAGSNIGTASASTPVLASPVAGPVYLVSHGGAAFPDVVLVLQGEGITLDLVGSIDIRKSITSSTFASVPDAPISSFELKLPEGPHSGLAAVLPAKAKGSLCGRSLVMPTTITGQNNAQIKQSTKIGVTGCAKVKQKVKKKVKRRGKRAGKK